MLLIFLIFIFSSRISFSTGNWTRCESVPKHNEIQSNNVTKRSSDLNGSGQQVMFVSSLFHYSGMDEDCVLYVIYERPTPALVLAASLRSVDGDDSRAPRWAWRASTRAQQPFPLGVDLTRSYVQLHKRQLPNDLVAMEVTLTLGDDIYVQQVRILVVPSPISVVIDGGLLRTVNSNQHLTLNASNSFDPDKRLDLSSMTFTWYCTVMDNPKRSKRKRDVMNRIGQRQKISNLSRFRLKGNQGDQLCTTPRSNDNGQLDCRGFETPFTDIDGPVVVIESDHLTDGLDYVFRVAVTSSTESDYPVSIGHQEVSIVDNYHLPYVNIRCVYNCYNGHVNYMERLVMSSEGEKADDDWVWEVTRVSADDTSLSAAGPSVWNSSLFPPSHDTLYLAPHATPPVTHLMIARDVIVDGQQLNVLMTRLTTISDQRLAHLNAVECHVEPSTGFSLRTVYAVNCDYPGRMANVEFYQHTRTTSGLQTVLLSYGSFSMASELRLAPGDPDDNDKSQIMVRLIVEDYVHHEIYVSVQVRPYRDTDLCPTHDDLLQCLNRHFVSGHLSWLMDAGHHSDAIAISDIIANQMNDSDTDELKMQMRDSMVLLLKQTPIFETSSIVQLMMTIQTIFSHTDSAHSFRSQNETLEVILEATWTLYDLNDIRQPKFYYIRQAAQHSALAIDAILQVALQQRNSLSSFNSSEFSIDLDNQTTTIWTTSWTTKQVSPEVVNMRTIDVIWRQIGRALLRHEVPGGMQHFIDTKLCHAQFVRLRYQNDSRCPIVFGVTADQSPMSSHVRLPIDSFQLDGKTLDVKIVKYTKHPLTGLPSAPSTGQSQAVSLSVRHVETDTYISHFQPPVDVIVFTSSHSSDVHGLRHRYGVQVKSFGDYDDTDIFVVRFKLPDFSYPVAIFFAVSSDFSDQTLQVVASSGRRPIMTDFTSQRSHTFVGQAWAQHNATYFDKCERHTPLSTLIPHSSDKSRFLYFGLLPANRSTNTESLSFQADILGLTCFRWSPKSDRWLTHSCQPVISEGNNNPQLVHCRCSHLSLITASSRRIPFVHERYEPFSFELRVPFNATILYFLAGLLILAIILILIGFFLSRHSRFLGRVTLVKDNDPHHRYSYLVTLHTGYRQLTSARLDVTIKLLGTMSDSRYYHLSDRCRTLFGSGAQDSFLVVTDGSLGVLQGVSVLVTCTESAHSWYLSEVRVYDLQSGHSWMFKASRWTRLRGVQQSLFRLSGQFFTSEEMDNQYSYQKRMVQRFSEDYIILNCLFNSAVSNFTHEKRVLCLVVIILLTLFVNLLLRGIPSQSPLEHIGPTDFSVRPIDIVWGAVTAPIILAFSLVVVYATKHVVNRWRRWDICIDHDEDWKQLTEGNVSTYVVPLQEDILTVTICPAADHKAHGGRKTGKKSTKQLERCFICENNQWAFLTVAIITCVTLAILEIVFGLRYSVAKSLLWIFSSTIGFLIWAFVLYPIALLVLAAILPPIIIDKHENRKNLNSEFTKMFETRAIIIKKIAPLTDYDIYLSRLRQHCIYRPIHVPGLVPSN